MSEIRFVDWISTPGGNAQSAGQRASTPLLTPESGNAATNAVIDIVDRTAAPFQTLGDPNVSALTKAQRVVAAAAGLANAPTDVLNDAFARATNSISQALPSLPAATTFHPVLGIPHVHTHPPAMPNPLPAAGVIMTGSFFVLINGQPAARAGDYGIGPTCGGATPVFEIFTGSSKVFLGGARAARIGDLTRQCMPAPPPSAPLGKVAAIAQGAAQGASLAALALGVVGAAKDVITTNAAASAAPDPSASAAEAAAAAATAAADAKAAGLAATAMGADIAMSAAKMAMGALMGKDPGAPPCLGFVMMGSTNVLIGGFPMPSWGEVAKGLKKLVGKLRNGLRRTSGRARASCGECS